MLSAVVCEYTPEKKEIVRFYLAHGVIKMIPARNRSAQAILDAPVYTEKLGFVRSSTEPEEWIRALPASYKGSYMQIHLEDVPEPKGLSRVADRDTFAFREV